MYFVSVALFSALGGICRYGIGLLIGEHAFPYATLAVNLIGCFLMAVVIQLLAKDKKRSQWFLVGIGPGFIGSFTTFSSFSVENFQLIQSGEYIASIIYIGSSLWGGLLFAYLGYQISAFWLTKKRRDE